MRKEALDSFLKSDRPFDSGRLLTVPSRSCEVRWHSLGSPGFSDPLVELVSSSPQASLCCQLPRNNKVRIRGAEHPFAPFGSSYADRKELKERDSEQA